MTCLRRIAWSTVLAAPFLLAQAAPSHAEDLSCRWDAWLKATVCDHEGERVVTCKPNRWTRRTDCKSQTRSPSVAPVGALVPWRQEKGQWEGRIRPKIDAD